MALNWYVSPGVRPVKVQAAVDPEADWHQQIRQAVEAYVGHIEARPAITLSWIRELPSLGAVARPVQRRGLQLLSSLLIDLSASPGFRRADLPPLTAPLAVILLAGLRELTALAVEDGRAEYRGFELSATGEVTRDLSIYVSGLALDAEQVSGAPTVVSGKTVTPTAVGKLIDNTPRMISLSFEPGAWTMNS